MNTTRIVPQGVDNRDDGGAYLVDYISDYLGVSDDRLSKQKESGAGQNY